MNTIKPQPLQLWGTHEDVTLYLEWNDSDTAHKTLHRILVFVAHPQLFLLPWGNKWAEAQDQGVWIAHKLARLDCATNFHQQLHWYVVNRFEKLQKYPDLTRLAQAALHAVNNAQNRPKRSIPQEVSRNHDARRPGAWSASKAIDRLLLDSDVNSFLKVQPSASTELISAKDFTTTVKNTAQTFEEAFEEVAETGQSMSILHMAFGANFDQKINLLGKPRSRI